MHVGARGYRWSVRSPLRFVGAIPHTVSVRSRCRASVRSCSRRSVRSRRAGRCDPSDACPCDSDACRCDPPHIGRCDLRFALSVRSCSRRSVRSRLAGRCDPSDACRCDAFLRWSVQELPLRTTRPVRRFSSPQECLGQISNILSGHTPCSSARHVWRPPFLGVADLEAGR